MELPVQLEYLRNEKVWLNYIMVFNAQKNGGKGGYDKPPVNPFTMRNGSSTDATGWATFDECNARIGKIANVKYKGGKIIEQAVFGVGLVLDAAGLVGVDLDHVIDRDATGKATARDEAKKIIRHIRTYAEVSVSGTGIHLLAKGRKPGADVCKVLNEDGSEYELYDAGRYFTLTGDTLPGCPEIRKCDPEIKWLYDGIRSRREKQRAETVSSVASCTGGSGNRLQPDESDAELWAKMFRSKHGPEIRSLYDGDLTASGGDASRADQALVNHLAYWTNYDAVRIDRMFRQTGLMREKWAAREDYRDRTIGAALEGKTPYRAYTAAEKRDYARKRSAEEWNDRIRPLMTRPETKARVKL